MVADERFFMMLALAEAWKYQGLTYPNPAVGCTVTEKGRIIAVEAHHKAGEPHAEVAALAKSYENLSGRKIPVDPKDASKLHEFLCSLPENFFSSCTIYVTLEPCGHEGKTPSCAELLSRLNPRKVVVAAEDPVPEHSGGIRIMAENGVQTEAGLCKEEAEALIEPFRIWQKRAFVLFKLAQTSNGRIGGDI